MCKSQIAKLRAARTMWADVMKNRMGAKKVWRDF
jgi:methylmalonyl-CoA mutase N-terminal domain/subunit